MRKHSHRATDVFEKATRLAVEALERRVLLSVAPLFSVLPETAASSPANIFQLDGRTYFTAGNPVPAVYVTDGTAVGTQQVAPLPVNGFISGSGTSNGVDYFAIQGQTGQLWRTDGTQANTRELIDFGPSSDGPRSLTDLNGTLFFIEGGRLWKSDGTDVGTSIVTAPMGASAIGSFNGAIVCAAGNGLYVTDGSAAGTTRISTVAANVTTLTDLAGSLYFQGLDATHGYELWTTDGTPAGTQLVKDIYPGTTSSMPASITNVNGELFFSAYSSSQAGVELWKSDGTTAGTTLVTDLNPLGSSNPSMIQNLNGLAAFVAYNTPVAQSVFVSDGTAAGTQPLSAIELGTTMRVVGGKAYFESSDPINGRELWASDGTAGGTGLVADINPGPGNSNPVNFAAVASQVYFSADDGAHGAELWKSDGTSAGTSMVADIDQDPAPAGRATSPIVLGNRVLYSDGSGLWALDNGATVPARLTGALPLQTATVGGTVFFAVGDSTAASTSLWKTDGTQAGTVLLRTFPAGDGPHTLFAGNGLLYFSGKDSGASDYALWSSDGTAAGTAPLLTTDGESAFDPSAFGTVGATVYFNAYDSLDAGGHGYELWKTDGTSAGTRMVNDIVPGVGSSAPSGVAPSGPAALGGSLLFAATSPAGAVELYSGDGAPGGTVPLTNFSATPGAAMQTDFNGGASVVAMGGLAYFMAHDAAGVQALWKSDGTPGGTMPVTAVDPGDASPAVDLTPVGSQLFFVDVHGEFSGEYDLWRSDGTAGGTLLLKRFKYDTPNLAFAVGNIVGVGGAAYFWGWSEATGQELWRSDGTVFGTQLVADVLPGPGSSNVENIVDGGNGTVLFDALPQAGMSAGLYRYTVPTGMPVVTGLTATVAGPFEVDLSWDPPSEDVSGYTLELSSTSDFSTIIKTVALPPSVTSYANEMLDPQATYYYRLTAFNPNGISPAVLASATTPQAAWNPGFISSADPLANWYLATHLTPFKHQIVFKALDPVLGYSAYRSDGVHSVLLVGGGVNSVGLSDDGQSILIVQNLSTPRTWISDGTVAGTVLAGSAAGGSASGATIPVGAVMIGGKGFYQDLATDGSHQVFAADATSAPPVQLTFLRKDLTLGGAQPYDLTAAYGNLYFVAWVPGGPTGSMPALFRSDGTPEGTWIVLTAPANRFPLGNIVAANGKVFFSDSQNLWVTDGTPAGTMNLKAFGASNDPEITAAFTVNNQFYFATRLYAGQNQNGTLYDGEFWTSDGTAAGTRQVPGLPIVSPVSADSPSQFQVLDGNIWFTADASSAVTARGRLYHYTPLPTVVTLPPAPGGLSVSRVFGSQINLSWADTASNEEGFRLERSSTSDFSTVDATFDLPAGTNHFFDTSLARGVTVYYRVRAFNAASLSDPVMSGPVATPNSPPGLSGLTATPDLVTPGVILNWSDSASASDHETAITLERSTRSDFASIDQTFSLPAGSTQFEDGTALSQTQYWYRVYSSNAAGDSEPTIIFLRTPLFPPFAPTALYASPVSKTEIDLQWADNSNNETGFVIERSDGSGFVQIGQVGVNATGFADGSAVAGTVYSYRVYAVDAGGPSRYSNVATSTTLPLPLATPVTQLPPFVPVAVDSGANASAVTVVNGIGLFKAQDMSTSPGASELWRTDGTAGGTTLLASYPQQSIDYLLPVVGGYAYYTVASSFTGQMSMWRTDGTASTQVANLFSVGQGQSFPQIRSSVAYQNRLYFITRDDNGHGEVCVADAGGVQLLGTFFDLPTGFAVFNNTLYFYASSTELWKTDGTVAGTVSTTDFVPGIGLPRVTYGNTTLYTDITSLYSNNGTPGGTSVVYTEAGGAGITMLTPIAGGVAFMAKNNRIFFSDGTSAGTVLLATLPHAILSMAAAGNRLYFVEPNSYFELWQSDLTPAGTHFVTSMTFGINRVSSVNGITTFTGGVDGQVWTTDGTDAGTNRITNIGLLSTAGFPDWVTGSNGTVYYTDSGTSADGPNSGTSGLWAMNDSTGTAPTQIFSGAASYPYDFNGVLYFVAKDAKGRVGLYRANPVSGTSSLVYADSNLGRPAILGGANGLLYFVDSSNTRLVYVSDGTTAGTHVISGARMYAPLLSGLEKPYAISGGYLYFRGSDGGLMRTDGTTTIQITTPAYNYQVGARVMTDVNGTLFFTLYGPTVMLCKLAAGDTTATVLSQYSQFQDPWLVNDLTNVNGTLYFAAPQDGAGTVLWKSDGTAGGTVPVFDPSADTLFGVNGAKIFGITNVNGTAYFFLDEATSFSPPNAGSSLWKTEGSAAGTLRIRAVVVTSAMQGAHPELFALSAGGYLVFSDGQFLWRSDGTLAGTIQIDTIGTASDGTQSTAQFLGPAATVVNGTDVFYSGAIAGFGRNLRIASLAVPATPTGLTASGTNPAVAATAGGAAAPAASGSSPIYLHWQTGASYPSGYVIERSLSSDFNSIDARFFVAAPATSYTDNTAAAGGVYFYRIRAVTAGGQSTFTGPAAFAPLANTIQLAGSNHQIKLVRDADGTHIDWTAGGATGRVLFSDPAGLTINGDGANDLVTFDLSYGVALPSVIHFNGKFTLSGLTDFAVLNGITFDIGRSTLYVPYTPQGSLQGAVLQLISRGYNGGLWNGAGSASGGAIASSNAGGAFGIGYADSADGAVVGPPANTVEIRYTVMGDTNLDGVVNATDAITMARNYLTAGGTRWDRGDFNFDGTVNYADALILQKNFNVVLTAPAVQDATPSANTTTVEPVEGADTSTKSTSSSSTSSTSTSTSTSTSSSTGITGVTANSIAPSPDGGSTVSQPEPVVIVVPPPTAPPQSPRTPVSKKPHSKQPDSKKPMPSMPVVWSSPGNTHVQSPAGKSHSDAATDSTSAAVEASPNSQQSLAPSVSNTVSSKPKPGAAPKCVASQQVMAFLPQLMGPSSPDAGDKGLAAHKAAKKRRSLS